MNDNHKPQRAIFDKKKTAPSAPPRRAAVDLNSTTNAQVWAEEFMRLFGYRLQEVDEGLMISWFANAIEVGREAGRVRALEAYGHDPLAAWPPPTIDDKEAMDPMGAK